jgi:hypothetical protein
MLVKVFVLGRPGSGKTTAVLQIIEKAKQHNFYTFRIKDYELLYAMFEHERKTLHYPNDITNRKFRQTDYKGFDILDYSVLDTALEHLEKKVQVIQHQHNMQDGIITIEFARDDYQKALKNFSPEFLQDAYFFFVETEVEQCINRIYRRITNPPQPDHHFVSDYVMHTYYNQDNRLYMAEQFREDYGITKKVQVYYNIHSLKTYLDAVDRFTDELFNKEFGYKALVLTANKSTTTRR